jgi:hypothetical protein
MTMRILRYVLVFLFGFWVGGVIDLSMRIKIDRLHDETYYTMNRTIILVEDTNRILWDIIKRRE